ncbi:MAG: hypothetical protein UW78_C0012G0002 [Candidatus Azambacteria bacterium GW2011_GWA1_44_9]|uniref:DUF3644 domain-containing protein n=1 Tax=Candidatus Azambacteria bacterium GW2011_GWA1_44_9 TaxID=1618610 RepID=A0A0G1KCN6_9BACT|nr:MAG: hypothetical protein UW78_C0012G0002 [Candidatus Azambacteria bacterium GW2011_GWA1_44_9]
MKAYLIEKGRGVNVIYKEDGKTISLDRCLNLIFNTAEENAVKHNIRDVADLRDEATHLIIQELEKVYVGLFQKGILHYLEYRKKWFGSGIKISPRMITLVLDFDPRNIAVVKIKSNYGKQVADYFEKTQTKIIKNINKYGSNYSIQIGYKLALVPNPKNADFTVGKAINSSPSNGIFIEVPKDIAKTHPYLSTRLIGLVKDKTKVKFGLYELSALKHFEKIDDKRYPNFIYRNSVYKNPSPQYSQQFLDHIIKMTTKKDYLQKCIEAYKQRPKSVAQKTIDKT